MVIEVPEVVLLQACMTQPDSGILPLPIRIRKATVQSCSVASQAREILD